MVASRRALQNFHHPPESIAAAAADMTVRDSAGDSLLTCACAKRLLDWVELLSPQVKQCDLQSVDNKSVLPPLFACAEVYQKIEHHEIVVKMIDILALLMTDINIQYHLVEGGLLYSALDSVVGKQWRIWGVRGNKTLSTGWEVFRA